MPLTPTRNYLPAGFVVGGCAIFLSLIGMLIFQQGQATRQIQTLIADNRQVLGDAGEMNILVRDAERGQRGYLLTGSPEYLLPYDAAVQRLPLLRERFQHWAAGNDDRQRRMAELWSLVQRKLAELAQTIQLRDVAGEEAARQVVLSNLGQVLMTKITTMLDAVSAEENRDLEERTTAMRRAEGTMYLSAAGGSCVAVLFLVLAAVTLSRSAARTREMEREREQQHRELDRSNAILRDMAEQNEASQYAHSLLEASPNPQVTIDLAGKISDVNEAAIRITGVKREDLIGTDFSDYFTEPERARQGYQRVFAEGSLLDCPLTIRHRDESLTEVLYNASVYRDTGGNLLGVFAGVRDVTARRKAESGIVEQRGKELERLAELERFQRLTVGRELKMIELKREIEDLKRHVRPSGETGNSRVNQPDATEPV
jgi:PAS domain S-box-containing protein